MLKVLDSTRPDNRSQFEQHLASTDELHKTLVSFAQADPAVLLWHGQGKFANLFKFLAARFLLAPDHVLDAERVHARWQWFTNSKRSLTHSALNGMLRLSHYLEHNEGFPSDEDLDPHLVAERREHDHRYKNLSDDVALGERPMRAPGCSTHDECFTRFSF